MQNSTIIQQLNQRSTINHFQLQDHIDDQWQEKLLAQLRDIAPYNPHYCKLFLKRYITFIEQNHLDLVDELYEFYVQPSILNSHELALEDFDVLTYTFPTFQLKIQENPRLISSLNTTGLRTWEAAIYLSEFLIKEKLVGNVLELGCGTGLVSMALIKSGQVNKTIVTDGSSLVFDNLQSSLKLNGLDNNDSIKCQQFIWGQSDPLDVEYLVGADITYDSSILDELKSTIAQFLNLNTKAAYIGATIRNLQTINDWEAILNDNFSWKVVEKSDKPEELLGYNWYQPGSPEIRIYEIKKKLN